MVKAGRARHARLFARFLGRLLAITVVALSLMPAASSSAATDRAFVSGTLDLPIAAIGSQPVPGTPELSEPDWFQVTVPPAPDDTDTAKYSAWRINCGILGYSADGTKVLGLQSTGIFPKRSGYMIGYEAPTTYWDDQTSSSVPRDWPIARVAQDSLCQTNQGGLWASGSRLNPDDPWAPALHYTLKGQQTFSRARKGHCGFQKLDGGRLRMWCSDNRRGTFAKVRYMPYVSDGPCCYFKYNDLHMSVVGDAGCCFPGKVVNTFSQDRGRVIKVTGHRSFEVDFVRVRVRQYDPGLMLSVTWLAQTTGEWNQP